MQATDGSLPTPLGGRGRDRRNRRRTTLWALAWALSYLVVSLGMKRDWWPLGVTVAGVVVTAVLGAATLLAYRRFLGQTDELRRKIEVEALALAFGVGAIGGLSYWLLAASGAAPLDGFVFVLVGMILLHPAGVLIGLRRYS